MNQNSSTLSSRYKREKFLHALPLLAAHLLVSNALMIRKTHSCRIEIKSNQRAPAQEKNDPLFSISHCTQKGKTLWSIVAISPQRKGRRRGKRKREKRRNPYFKFFFIKKKNHLEDLTFLLLRYQLSWATLRVE